MNVNRSFHRAQRLAVAMVLTWPVVAQAAEITTTGVSHSQQSAADLARMGGELRALVARFQLS